jgi:uncharacterized protein YceK
MKLYGLGLMTAILVTAGCASVKTESETEKKQPADIQIERAGRCRHRMGEN